MLPKLEPVAKGSRIPFNVGKTDVTKGIEYCFNEINDCYNKDNIIINNKESVNKINVRNQIDSDKEFIKIDNNGQIININIKTEQKSIEDAWSQSCA